MPITSAGFDALLARLTPPLQLALVTEAFQHPRVADADGVRARLHDSEPEMHAAAIAALGAVGETGDVVAALDFEREPEVLQTGDECAVALAIRAIPAPATAAPPAGR